jgi:hypothetical protein
MIRLTCDDLMNYNALFKGINQKFRQIAIKSSGFFIIGDTFGLVKEERQLILTSVSFTAILRIGFVLFVFKSTVLLYRVASGYVANVGPDFLTQNVLYHRFFTQSEKNSSCSVTVPTSASLAGSKILTIRSREAATLTPS